jgi:hypothetical protein
MAETGRHPSRAPTLSSPAPKSYSSSASSYFGCEKMKIQRKRPLRVGCVKYLNARPLIQGWEGKVVLDHPSTLCAQLARGELESHLSNRGWRFDLIGRGGLQRCRRSSLQIR